jgi:Family of unknown function (DUF6788)
MGKFAFQKIRICFGAPILAYTCIQMKASSELARLSDLALRQRRQGLANQLPPVTETLRGSLVERYVTCGNPACKCAKGERHGPVWYLTVTLGPGKTTGGIVASDKVEQVRGWVQNYQKVKDHLEKISAINRELLRRERDKRRRRKSGKGG